MVERWRRNIWRWQSMRMIREGWSFRRASRFARERAFSYAYSEMLRDWRENVYWLDKWYRARFIPKPYRVSEDYYRFRVRAGHRRFSTTCLVTLRDPFTGEIFKEPFTLEHDVEMSRNELLQEMKRKYPPTPFSRREVVDVLFIRGYRGW